MNYVIVTGGSRGLGLSLVERLSSMNYQVICVSRSMGNPLDDLVTSNEKIDFIPFDLANVEQIDVLIAGIFAKINKHEAESIHLINNAGILSPMKPLGRCDSEEIIKNININLVAPMLLTAGFIRETKGIDCERRVINVSSGAGKNPVFGWNCYGAAKAGMNMMSQITSMEQLETSANNPVKVVSFAPGIIDTDMQSQIRASNRKDFSQVERFVEYKEEGKLLSPEVVADVVVQLLTAASFPNGKLVSVSDYL